MELHHCAKSITYLLTSPKDWLDGEFGLGVQTVRFSQVNQQTNLPAGTAKKYLKVAAGKLGLKFQEEGTATIMIDMGSNPAGM